MQHSSALCIVTVGMLWVIGCTASYLIHVIMIIQTYAGLLKAKLPVEDIMDTDIVQASKQVHQGLVTLAYYLQKDSLLPLTFAKVPQI